MIRPATEADIPVLIELGREFFNQSSWKELADFDPASSEVSIRLIISGGLAGEVLISDDGQGMAAYLCTPLFLNHNVLTATELVWYARKNGVPLLEAMEKSAKARGAVALSMLCLNGMREDVLDRFYRMRGYRKSEFSYLKRL